RKRAAIVSSDGADFRGRRRTSVHYRVLPLPGADRARRAWHWRDLAAMALVAATILLLGVSARQMTAPFVAVPQSEISLAPQLLPLYTLRTVTRMLAALLASL